MEMGRRDFLAGGLGLAASVGLARVQAQQSDAVPPLPPKRDVPHRKVKTTNLFKAPPGYPNAVAIAPEGVWVAEQKAQNFSKDAKRSPEACWLLDWNGKLLKTVLTESCNTSGMAYGDGHIWMGANGWPGRHLPDRHELQDGLAPPDPAGAGRRWRRLPWPDVA